MAFAGRSISDAHARLDVSDRRDNMGGGNNWPPSIRRVPVPTIVADLADLDCVDAQGIVGWLGMAGPPPENIGHFGFVLPKKYNYQSQ
jgi:hypothetical protein